MPEPLSGLPDFDACADRDCARLLAERLEAAAPERQLALALTA